MTDSESDFPRDYRRHILKLLYASADTPNATYSIREIASAVGAEQDTIIREIEGIPELSYDGESNTVHLRRAAFDRHGSMGGGRGVDGRGGAGGAGGAVGGGRTVVPWGQIDAVGAVKKVKHRRPLGKSSDIRVVSDATKGRVGYVCVADEFILDELERYYKEQGYYTKCDYDVLHIRFSNKELQQQQDGGDGSAISAARAVAGGAVRRRDTTGGRGAAPESAPSTAARGASLTGQRQLSPLPSGPGPFSQLAGSLTDLLAGDQPASGPLSRVGQQPQQQGLASTHPSGAKETSTSAAAAANADVPSPQKKHGFDLFVFQYGAIVWWGFDQKYFKIVEQDFMFPSSKIQKYLVNRYRTQTINDIYPVWCTYSLERKETLEPDDDFKERLLFDHFLIPFSSSDLDSAGISMLCASHALAQSAKIDYLEIKIQDLTQSCKPLPRELKEYGRVTITERRLLQLRGEVLSYRLMLKSGSDLLDEPELFWQNAYLKPIFQATKECFEISERVRALDTKLDAGNEILSMIADQFTERHGARLEWIVIWLVLVEVIIGVLELLLDVRPWL